ncbi:hypothetical protein CS542_02160 [Pedobacter sp. IW39]|nr:hypothetical protein CS542_02160 [Pedobacter sp. IW39]
MMVRLRIRFIMIGKNCKTYLNLEPRFSAAYQLNTVSSLKAAYGRNTQSIHRCRILQRASNRQMVPISSNRRLLTRFRWVIFVI